MYLNIVWNFLFHLVKIKSSSHGTMSLRWKYYRNIADITIQRLVCFTIPRNGFPEKPDTIGKKKKKISLYQILRNSPWNNNDVENYISLHFYFHTYFIINFTTKKSIKYKKQLFSKHQSSVCKHKFLFSNNVFMSRCILFFKLKRF